MSTPETWLKELSESHGITGREEPVTKWILEQIRPTIDDFRFTPMGNLLVTKKGSHLSHPKIMISTHVDEIGLVVSAVLENGFVRVEPRGGVDPKILPAHPFMILTQTRPVKAVGISIPPHLLQENDKKELIGFENMLLDTGLSHQEAQSMIQIGDPIVFQAPLLPLMNQRFAGKSLDDRASALVSMLLLKELTLIKHEWDVVCTFSVQEEVGCKGAETAPFALKPDIAIAIDVTFAEQPDMGETEGIPFGEGIPIAVGPDFTKKITQDLFKVAKLEGIKTVIDPFPMAAGTDATPLQVSQDGIPTALLSLPLRNMHTSVEVVDMSDIKNTVKLLTAYIKTLDHAYWEGLSWT